VETCHRKQSRHRTGARRHGASIVTATAGAGYKIVATSRSIPASTDPRGLTVRATSGCPTRAPRRREAVARFGRVDLLVNNAGIFLANAMTAYSDEDYASAPRPT
jgi:NAD(P)-dependent dehydrogenase (short-subunit alcohol dehydrogenase family)